MLAQIKRQRKRLANGSLTVTELTKRQSQVLAYMLRCWLCGGLPTVREIAGEFDITSPNGVMCHLRALRKKGYVHNEHGCGFWLTDKALKIAVE